MRFIALPASFFTALLLTVAPLSAQTISTRAVIINAPGTITSCPVTITFHANIGSSQWPATANRQVQYKWIRSDGADSPTQTLNFPAGGPQSTTVSTTWQIGANGTFWEAIQISYPPIANPTSNQATFSLTCPTPGSLVIGSPVRSGVVNPGPNGLH